MALAAAVTIGGQTGWSPVSLPKGSTSTTVANPTDLASQDSMMAALFAVSPTTFTMARLLNMTSNDMVYALRIIQDPSNI